MEIARFSLGVSDNMQHQFYDADFLVTLKKLHLFATDSEIRIGNSDEKDIIVNTGTFYVETKAATFTISKHPVNIGGGSGFVDIRVEGSDADIVLDANTGGSNSSFLTVNTKGILSAFGNPAQPAFIRLDSNSVNLGKGLMLPGPTLGGKITITDDSVVLQAGLSKISITPTGIVIQCGLPGAETKFELSSKSIKESVLNVTKSTLESTGYTLESAATSLKITPASIDLGSPVIQVQSDASLKFSGPIAVIKGDAVGQVKAAILVSN